MDAIELISRHRSIRTFTDEPIAEDAFAAILEAAQRASTAGSMQLYSILATTDPARREVLAAIHLGSDVIKHAPLTLTFCVDVRRMTRWLELSGETARLDHMWFFMTGLSDALLAAQNALLAAENLGLGGCFQGSTIVGGPGLVPFFECPRGVLPVATLALGHPAEEPKLSSRLPARAVVHRERYTELPDAELAELHGDHAKETFERLIASPHLGAGARAGGIEDLQAYYARYQYPGDLMEIASGFFMGLLHLQGFCTDEQVPRNRAVRQALLTPEIAQLHPIRQYIFAMALVSRHGDHLLDRPPVEAEAEVAAFLTRKDPTILDDVTTRGFFDVATRSRLSVLLAQLDSFG